MTRRCFGAFLGLLASPAITQATMARAEPVGWADLPRPPAIYDAYDTRPDFSMMLPPEPPRPSLANPVPATPPPPTMTAPLALPERPGDETPEGGLRQALSEYDRRAGLGAAPTIASYAARLLKDAGPWGRATLVLAVDARGTIETARVLSSSQDDAAWQQFASALQRKNMRVRLPAEARGLWMTVDLEARTGRPPGIGGGPLYLNPGSLGFDVADVAPPPRERLVHGSVVSEVWF